jgi:hypothetical protein
MALTVETIDIWREYLQGVMNRANHHAQNVNEIALALIGAIIWRSTDEVKVMEREGEAKNILWMCVNGRNFCFTYDHSNGGFIAMREGNSRGNIIHRFTNQTTNSEVKEIFENL